MLRSIAGYKFLASSLRLFAPDELLIGTQRDEWSYCMSFSRKSDVKNHLSTGSGAKLLLFKPSRRSNASGFSDIGAQPEEVEVPAVRWPSDDSTPVITGSDSQHDEAEAKALVMVRSSKL
jgi:hypothetical protein